MLLKVAGILVIGLGVSAPGLRAQPTIQQSASLVSQKLIGCNEIRTEYSSEIYTGNYHPTVESPGWLWKKFELNGNGEWLEWELHHVTRSDRSQMLHRYVSTGYLFSANVRVSDLWTYVTVDEVTVFDRSERKVPVGVHGVVVRCSPKSSAPWGPSCMIKRDGTLKHPGGRNSVSAFDARVDEWQLEAYGTTVLSDDRGFFFFPVCGGKDEAERLQRAFVQLIRSGGGK